MAGKFKKETEKDVTFAEGGDTPMFGSQDAGKQAPGGTAHKVSGGDGKFATGGSGKMFGYAGSVPATAGQTGAR
jgi:hypothetical protein